MYGTIELIRQGLDISLIEDVDIGLDALKNRSFWGILNFAFYKLFGIPLWMLKVFSGRQIRQTLNGFETILVTTNSFGISLGILKKFGLLQPGVVFIAMGLLEKTTKRHIVWIYRWIFRNIHICALSQPEARFLEQKLDVKVSTMPFGIDVDFWHPSPQQNSLDSPTEDFVLSIGNDRHRDYHTLISAWKLSYPKLVIVTKLSLHITSSNIELRYGDWHSQSLDDSEIRNLFWKSKFVIIPIRSTHQPSGQSATLQAMACGKSVILPDFDGLWDRQLLVDGKTVVLAGKPGSVEGVQSAIERLLSNTDKSETIGLQASKMVTANLSSVHMADRLRTILQSVASHSC